MPSSFWIWYQSRAGFPLFLTHSSNPKPAAAAAADTAAADDAAVRSYLSLSRSGRSFPSTSFNPEGFSFSRVILVVRIFTTQLSDSDLLLAGFIAALCFAYDLPQHQAFTTVPRSSEGRGRLKGDRWGRSSQPQSGRGSFRGQASRPSKGILGDRPTSVPDR
ncbi:hypothetical protein AKJ16_DCAP23134 [Drosera capensis]